MKKIYGFVVVLSLLFTSAVSADELFGVQVYPGAKLDVAASKVLREQITVNGSCYRTNDSVKKVAKFYEKQGLKLAGDITEDSAIYRTNTGVNVTIQNPWLDLNTGAMMHDTLISIVNTKE
jgi:hypothetical protein